LPITFVSLRAHFTLEVIVDVGGDGVVVQQRIVDVEEKNDFGFG
jgi:hypothetical protein